MTRNELRAALDNANVRAFLRLIREKESSQIDDGLTSAYTVINGGRHFTDTSRHPWQGITTGNGAKACGAYQFLGTTWGRLCEQYGFADFGPESQDLGAVALIIGRGALGDVIAGRIEDAIRKCRPEWTSLPGAAESRPSWTMAAALQCYERWGGSVTYPDRADAAAPIEDHSREAEMAETAATTSIDWAQVAKFGGAVASFFNPIAGAALTALSPLLQSKVEQEIGRHTDPATAKQTAAALSDAVINSVKAATGKADELEAVVALRKDATAAAAVEQAVVTKLSELQPFLDASHKRAQDRWAADIAGRDAASLRNLRDRWDMTPLLVKASVAMTAVIVVGLMLLLALKLWIDPKAGLDPTLIGLLAGILTLVVKGFMEILAYRFDGTKADEIDAAAITKGTTK